MAVVIQRERGHGHHHIHVALRCEHGDEGGELRVVSHEVQNPDLAGGLLRRSGRRVVRIVVAQPGRDILGVRSHLNDQEHAQYDDNGNEEPGEGDGLDPHVGGDDFRGLDEKWAGQGAHKGSGEDYPQALRPAVRWVHVRGRHSKLLDRSRTQAEYQDSCDKDGE